MLDKWMNDSCAYWKEALDLDAPQEAKMDLIYRELRLHPGMRLLDIGCGWAGPGGLCRPTIRCRGGRDYGFAGADETGAGTVRKITGNDRIDGLPQPEWNF